MQHTETAMKEALQRGDLAAALLIAIELDKLGPSPRASILGAALWYAERGLPVFPLMPGSKIPYPKTHGVGDATMVETRIRELFAGRQEANLAIATGVRVDVIDFDGAEAHAEWGRRWPNWEDAGVTVLGTVSTPRPGGLHVYVPASGEGNYAGMVPGVDYRGLGGYVVVPPSITAVGSYRWLRPLAEVLP